MKLTVTTFVSVDGVMQGPGGPTEDTSDGFERGGWLVPHFDEPTGEFMNSVFERVDAFLLGRRTYDIFAAAWPNATDADDPVATKLNTLPKHVASTTLRAPEWNGTSVIEGDGADVVRALKAQPGGELQVHGSGTLVRYLIENDLVDELNLRVLPVLVGGGRRLFAAQGPALGLRLVESRTTPSGVAIQRYATAGPAEFGTVEVE